MSIKELAKKYSAGCYADEIRELANAVLRIQSIQGLYCPFCNMEIVDVTIDMVWIHPKECGCPLRGFGFRKEDWEYRVDDSENQITKEF